MNENVSMRFGPRQLSLGQPAVMGVLNMTPDSFSDGGKYHDGQRPDIVAAYDSAQRMVDSGAIFVDIGGESTRPGAKPVSSQQEMDRVLPVVQRLAGQLDAVISVDSSNPELMREAARCGAGLLNDIRAFQGEGALEAASQSGLPMCLMHMQGQPATMQSSPEYSCVVDEVKAFLQARVQACLTAGVSVDRLIIDPGFGFGKMLKHNLRLLGQLESFVSLDMPILVGMSRKSMIGQVLDREVGQRLHGGLALAAIAVNNGASIVRTHDVAETVDAVKMAYAVRSAG